MSFIDKNVVGAGVLLVCTAAGLFELMRFPAEAKPFPALVLSTLLVAGLIWLVRSLFVRTASQNDAATTGDKRRLMAAIGLTFAYAVAVSHFSYFIPTVLYISGDGDGAGQSTSSGRLPGGRGLHPRCLSDLRRALRASHSSPVDPCWITSSRLCPPSWHGKTSSPWSPVPSPA